MSGGNKSYYVFPTSLADHQQEEEASPSPSPTLGEVGGKALSLYQTATAFPVPPGLVLTVGFFKPWLDQIKGTDAWSIYAEKESKSELKADDNNNTTKEDCDAIKKECKKNLSLNDEQLELLGQAVKAAFGNDAKCQSNKQSWNRGSQIVISGGRPGRF